MGVWAFWGLRFGMRQGHCDMWIGHWGLITLLGSLLWCVWVLVDCTLY